MTSVKSIDTLEKEIAVSKEPAKSILESIAAANVSELFSAKSL